MTIMMMKSDDDHHDDDDKGDDDVHEDDDKDDDRGFRFAPAMLVVRNEFPLRSLLRWRAARLTPGAVPLNRST